MPGGKCLAEEWMLPEVAYAMAEQRDELSDLIFDGAEVLGQCLTDFAISTTGTPGAIAAMQRSTMAAVASTSSRAEGATTAAHCGPPWIQPVSLPNGPNDETSHEFTWPGRI